MRHNPILSETDAFRLTIALVGLVVIGAVVGWLAAPAAGAIVFVVLGLIVLAIYMSVPERDRLRPLRTAAREHQAHATSHEARRVIVVANEPLAGDELGAQIRGADGRRVEVDVLAPVLVSRMHLAYTDIDVELREARERLARSLTWARGQGFTVRGEVGDPSPITALEDALRDFGADQVIVATRRPETRRWQEHTELERLPKELDVPVIQVTVE